jgi:hypothetical protein
MNGDNTYKQRNSIGYNRGEDIFLQWCKDKELKVHRLGFDEKLSPVDHFYSLSNFIRNLPDFAVTSAEGGVLVNVKGSRNLKAQEYENLDHLQATYESEAWPLWYVFALPVGLTWMRVAEVKRRYEKSTKVGRWPDGKEYKTL